MLMVYLLTLLVGSFYLPANWWRAVRVCLKELEEKNNRSHGLDKSFFNRGIPSNFGQTHLILVSHYIQFYPILCHRKLGLSGLFQPIIGK